MQVIVSTFLIFMFVYQSLLVDVFSQLYNLTHAKNRYFYRYRFLTIDYSGQPNLTNNKISWVISFSKGCGRVRGREGSVIQTYGNNSFPRPLL